MALRASPELTQVGEGTAGGAESAGLDACVAGGGGFDGPGDDGQATGVGGELAEQLAGAADDDVDRVEVVVDGTYTYRHAGPGRLRSGSREGVGVEYPIRSLTCCAAPGHAGPVGTMDAVNASLVYLLLRQILQC